MNFCHALAALFLTSTLSLVASAQEQPWVEDPDVGAGEGFVLGELELHPSFAAELGYDSNYLRRGTGDLDENGDQLPIIETLRLRLTPSLRINTKAVRRSETARPLYRFKLNSVASAGYSIFIPLEETDEFDGRSRIGGGVGAGFELFPEHVVTWDVSAAYRHTVDPSSVATGDFDFDRHTLAAGTGVTWRPGGGLFEWRLGYDFLGTYFSEGGYDAFNNHKHTVGTKGRWRFLPRTALLYDAAYRYIDYTNDEASQNGRTDGETIRSRLGVGGLITTQIAFRVMGGWAASFYKARAGVDPQNYDGPVGNAEIKWFISPKQAETTLHLSSVALGYEHDYAHSYLGPFYTSDRGYLNFRYFLGGAVVTSLEGYLAYITYPDFEVTPGGETQSDVSETRIGAKLFAEYRPASNIGINTTIAYDQNISDDEFELAPGDPAPGQEEDLSQDALRYRRFHAFIGGRVFW